MITNTLKSWFQNPAPPVIPRNDYAPPLLPCHTWQDISDLMPAAGQNAVPQPQKLYDLADYATPMRVLWNKPRNTLTG